MDWEKEYRSKIVSVEEAAEKIKSGDRLFVPGGMSSPIEILNALARRYQELQDVNIYAGFAMFPFDFLEPEYKGHITWNSVFSGPLERMYRPMGNVEIVLAQFSQMRYYLNNVAKPNVLLAEVSQPNEAGYMNYGPIGIAFNDIARETADMVIVQANKQVPFICGEGNTVHVGQVDWICEKDEPLAEFPWSPPSELDKKIAGHILPYIPDGATIQIGVGGISNAVGYGLEEKKDLGVHSEVITQSLIHLAQKGVINCKRKNYMPGKMVCTFGAGDKDYYQYIDNNPLFHMAPVDKVNDISIIAGNDNMISINNAVLVDLTGQVASEAFGYSQISGVGGALDFIRGTALSKGGKSFIALSSTHQKDGEMVSRVVLTLPPGTAVSVPRPEVQYVVTEYGVADLRNNRSISTRVRELVKIAHPDFRDKLMHDAREVKLI